MPMPTPEQMPLLAIVLAAVVALIHLYILVLEMFWWNTPRGHKAFGLAPDFAAATQVLAKNQGLYNGFLAAGIGWGLVRSDAPAVLFFLACVAVAGVYGAWSTGSRKILFIQTVPAVAAAVALLALGH
jgi:putative membrane protein